MYILSGIVIIFLVYLGLSLDKKQETVPVVNIPAVPVPINSLIYKNDAYGFTLTLPLSWQGYTVINAAIQYGNSVTIRHPLWTKEDPRMDIPILIYPIDQWNTWEKNNFEGYPTAAPIGPTERGRNAKYVFATAPRYNFSFATGFEEVDQIVQGLKGF